MKIALIQLNIAWESKKVNYEKAEFFAKKATKEKCDVIVFPEMFNTGFSMNVSAIAESENGETNLVLSEIAKKYSIYLIAGFPVKEQDEEKGRNIAVVYDRKGIRITTYTKIHPFSFSDEDKYYIAGSNPVIFNIDNIPCSIFICYDLRFPEVFRKVAKNVQVVFVIANWPASRKDHWETLLKARAIENQCFVIGANRTGTDGNGITYHGASHIFGPLGNNILCGDDKKEFLTGEINPSEAADVRSKFPFLKDMRI
ncbi:amidohydrolase [Dissulfurispira thermophila]|uniref:Amidohydrolase n=2 Tax=root TaxID=1 RepID=A0A7G1H2J5_9BACT|nr:carbon-nitrogen family hydrolase [Dissulfurispira thermophila]BCB95927.1 amidohydrolase [Dissulfurispira thermophila]